MRRADERKARLMICCTARSTSFSFFLLPVLLISAARMAWKKPTSSLIVFASSLEEANAKYEKLLGRAPYKSELVASEGVNTSFFQMGDSKLELLEATVEPALFAVTVNVAVPNVPFVNMVDGIREA